MESLRRKVVLVTGASSGIGRGIAVKMAYLGCRLALIGRNDVNLKCVSEECTKAGLSDEQVLIVSADINRAVDRQTIVENTIKTFGEINVLVNNAGMIRYDKVSSVTEDNYDELFDTNIKSHVFLTQLALPHIIKVKGSIINTSSICGQKVMPEVGVHCMTKAAMDMFTQCLALELAPRGVRVNAINPGTVVSNTNRRPWGKYQDEDLYQKYLEVQKDVHPVGRVGQPEDCAEAVAFLASDAASFITGQLLFIDGGRHCLSPGVATNVKM